MKIGLYARRQTKTHTKLAGQRRLWWMSRGERRVNAKSIVGVMM
jgi:phosphotransferase system HPr-like phosphotransfer protein